jgi:hypothetical protein
VVEGFEADFGEISDDEGLDFGLRVDDFSEII